MALDLSTLTTEQQLAAIYIGYYDRAADPVGEDFWEGAVANPNLSLADIATDFATQPETLIAYPFLSDPTAEQANAFISEVYLNLFNRAPDEAGLEFWSEALLAAIDGTGALTVGEIILSIIEGAQDSAEGNDRTTILNKIEVATSWTNAADAAAIDYTTDTAAQNSAKSIIEGVTDVQATVVAAKQTIDNFFEPAPVPDEEFLLTSATDVITGTADDDEFNAYIQQNPFAGGISNSLASADRLDGGAGNDRLYAELTFEFLGTNSVGMTDNSPRIKAIEEIDIEARDFGFGGYESPVFFDGPSILGKGEDGPDIIVDAKNITGHKEIGSYFSDGDLTIENLTTLTAPEAEGGVARNTSEITITMDHTDNFNSDYDASDLTVLFDNDYLLSGQSNESEILYFLLDEDAELAGLTDRLNNIDVDGIRFSIANADGTTTEIVLESDEANIAGTHQGFVNALQAPLQALIADGTLPAGTRIFLDATRTTTTFIDDGSESDPIPAIVVESGDGSELTALGFSRIEEEIGEYDVFGRFQSSGQSTIDEPISVNIDLHKVGRGGDGGDLIVGGKAKSVQDGIAGGIEVFNINVLGAGNDDPNGGMTKPSSLGTIQSTLGALDVVNIATDPVFAAGDTYASLEVREGFGGTLSLINADAFLGDLTLNGLVNVDTITAHGGGDVTLGIDYDGNETDTAFSVTTGAGDDDINIDLDGDALDYAGSSLNVATGDGDDAVVVQFTFDPEDNNNNQLNQAILDNVNIKTGSGDDFVDVDGVGNANIETGSGNDTVFTDGGTATALWAFNFDNVRVDAQGGLGGITTDDLPGVQPSLAYIGGATITVTLSGAGLANLAAGGGVMAEAAAGAIAGDDGYEATATISSLLNGNQYFGTQRDVNLAIIDAIESDAILSQLLTVSIASNNTLTISSNTSGAFAPTDLRIDISTVDAASSTYANSVLDEAQSVFGDSDLSLTDLWGTTSFSTTSPAAYQDDTTAPGADLTDSADANLWYDGLSVAGDANSADDNQKTAGTADTTENDNVINGGAGDDLIVLSTDSVATMPTEFTDGGNNALINGASNETIVLTGSNFGNDTVMNFEAGDVSTVPVTPQEFAVNFSGTVAPSASGAVATEVTVGLTLDGTLVTAVYSFSTAQTAAQVAAGVVGAINDAVGYTVASVVGGTTIQVLSADLAGAPTISVDDVNALGISVQNFPTSSFGVGPVDGTPVDVVVGSGIDFLDFTAYLTSQFNDSAAPGADSNELIDVTLDNPAGDDTAPTDVVRANEVVLVDLNSTTTAGETFATITAADVAALFNTTTDNFGDLTAAGFNADDTYTKTGNTPSLVGNATAILGGVMPESW